MTCSNVLISSMNRILIFTIIFCVTSTSATFVPTFSPTSSPTNTLPIPLLNLVGWYTYPSFIASPAGQWNDASGHGNTGSTSGVSTATDAAGLYGAGGSVSYVKGSGSSAVAFTSVNSGDFTVCVVARFIDSSWGRIIQGTNGNWLMGHYFGWTGTLYTNGWRNNDGAPGTTNNDYRWLSMCTTSVGSTAINGQLYSVNAAGVVPGLVMINDGGCAGCNSNKDVGDFAVLEVIIYTRSLSNAELTQIQTHQNYILSSSYTFLTSAPSVLPSHFPTSPTHRPTHPTASPTVRPTTIKPTLVPTKKPTGRPTSTPTSPSLSPTAHPTIFTEYLIAFTTTQALHGVNQTMLQSSVTKNAFVATLQKVLNSNGTSNLVSVSILNVVTVGSQQPSPVFGYNYNVTYTVANDAQSKITGMYQNISSAILSATTNNEIGTSLTSICTTVGCGLSLPVSVDSASTSMTGPNVIHTLTPTSAPTGKPTSGSTSNPTFAPTSPTVKPTLVPSSPTVPPTKRPSTSPSINPSRLPTVAPSIRSLAPTIQGQCFCNVKLCLTVKNVTQCAPGNSPQVYQ